MDNNGLYLLSRAFAKLILLSYTGSNLYKRYIIAEQSISRAGVTFVQLQEVQM